MEDLAAQQQCNKSSYNTLPEITQYGIRLPFRVAVVGQTDSGKTHSIMHRWLGGKISYWRLNEDGSLSPASLQIAYFAVTVVCHLVKKRIWCNILFPTLNNNYFTCLVFLQGKRFLNSFQ